MNLHNNSKQLALDYWARLKKHFLPDTQAPDDCFVQTDYYIPVAP